MAKKKTVTAPNLRTTIPIKGTVTRQEAQLDHASALAIDYARAWHKSGPGATGMDPLASGVIRRALAVYVQHLCSADIDPVAETRAVRSCCSVLKPDEDDREAAYARLEAHQAGHPFPSWRDVLHGPDTAAKWAAFDDRVDALVDQIHRERFKPKTTA